jgi:threonine aldolase
VADVVDLRSDTLTLPTPEMRRAMADAELGDDCYGEDPTINRLQELACEMLGTARCSSRRGAWPTRSP